MFALLKETYVALTAQNLTHGENPLLEFTRSGQKPEALRQWAGVLLKDENLVQNVLRLTPRDQERFVDKINEVFGTLNSQNAKDITALGVVYSEVRRLPSSAMLSRGLRTISDLAMGSGGFTDIWRGSLNGRCVVIKALRINPANGLTEAKEILWKRIPVWMRLSHPNILPFCGVDMTLFHLSLVYHWGENGNVIEYVARNPSVSRPSLLFGIAKGLEYLHSLGIPHGDVKGANVIVDCDGNPRLTECGLVSINSEQKFIDTSRWLAPEYATATPNRNASPIMETMAGDVFAFGMVGVEVFTGEVPFGNKMLKEAAALRISRGRRPGKPQNALALGLTDEMWELIKSCLEQDPSRRPTMEEVVSQLQEFVGSDDSSSVLPGGARTTMEPGECTGRYMVAAEAPQARNLLPALTRGKWFCVLFSGVVIMSIVFFQST